MNPENTTLEAFFVTGQMKNRSKISISENHDWLQNGTRLHDLRSFYDVVMLGRWRQIAPIRSFRGHAD